MKQSEDGGGLELKVGGGAGEDKHHREQRYDGQDGCGEGDPEKVAGVPENALVE